MDFKHQIDLYKAFGHAQFGDISISGTGNTIIVSALSRASSYPYDKDYWLAELQELKRIFTEGLSHVPELQQMICDKEIVYELRMPDGHNTLYICSEKNGQIDWGRK